MNKCSECGGNLEEIGNENYQCDKCGIMVRLAQRYLTDEEKIVAEYWKKSIQHATRHGKF